MTQPTSGDLFAALLRLGRALKRLAGTGPVDGPTLGVLMEITSRQPVRLSDVAATLGLDTSTISRHVGALERGGYVARESDPHDRRASRLVVTELGASAMADALGRRRALVDAATSNWSAPDRDALLRLLTRLGDDLARVTDAPSAGPRQEISA